MIPHFMFIAERGSGKTMVATEVAKQLIIDGKPKPAKEINCSTIKNVTQFVEQVMLPFVHDRECTILFDEASELPQDLTMSLLTMLNPNDNNRNTFVFGDYTFDIDFKKHSWLFATTEPQKVFHALMSRCTRIDFEPYTADNLMTIVQRNITKNSKVVFAEDGVKEQIPTVLRNNPREAQKMATDIVTYCARYKKKVFSLVDWNSLQAELGIQPMGLNATEIKVLRFLAKNDELARCPKQTAMHESESLPLFLFLQVCINRGEPGVAVHQRSRRLSAHASRVTKCLSICFVGVLYYAGL
jgi:Holliday junction resolvasome RuvABC ATP-dependent DNA helicase subunit